MSAGRRPVHGGSAKSGATPEYSAWRAARNKCFNANAAGVGFYGARTPKMCPRWQSFQAFLADVGLRPSPRHQFKLLNTEGDYEPGNVRWVLRGAAPFAEIVGAP